MKTKTMSTASGAHSLKIITLVVLLLTVILGGYLLNSFVMLKIREYDTGEILYQKSLKIGEPFTLEYIHSVTKQPVYEVFYVQDKDTLAIKEMRYDSFGANLPVGPEKLKDEKTNFIVEDGYYKITYEPDRSFEIVPLRVGQVVANHTLVFEDGERLAFLDVAEGGAYVQFYVTTLLGELF